jgi:hypothetical protein
MYDRLPACRRLTCAAAGGGYFPWNTRFPPPKSTQLQQSKPLSGNWVGSANLFALQ